MPAASARPGLQRWRNRINPKGAPGQYLQRTVSALIMATPWCLIPRFGMSFRCCIEASHGGATVLARRKIQARVAPCALLIVGPKRDKALSGGLTPEAYYRTLEARATPDLPPYEEWLAAGRFIDLHGQGHPIHMVIEAHHADHRVLIDLTFAQVNKTSTSGLNSARALRTRLPNKPLDPTAPAARRLSGMALGRRENRTRQREPSGQARFTWRRRVVALPTEGARAAPSCRRPCQRTEI